MPHKNALLRKCDTLQRRIRQNIHQRLHPCDKTTPVFIVGCQRSGTSTMLRVFDLCFDAKVYNTQDQRAYRLGILHEPATIHRLLDGSRATVTVLKPMNEIQRIPQFLREYPGLRIIWLLRHYGDVANSSVREFKDLGPTMKMMVEDPANAGWHGELLSNNQREVLKEHYHDNLSRESMYVLFWCIRNLFFFEYEHEPSVRVFKYEQFVQDPETEFGRIF